MNNPCASQDHSDPEVRESARAEAAMLTRLIISHARQAAKRGRKGSSGRQEQYFTYNLHQHKEEQEDPPEDA